MLAVVFDKTLKVIDAPVPKMKAGEALVRVALAGICNTDMEIVRGYMGFKGILGHEFVGKVEKCADEKLIGKRVVGEINASCGKCGFCRKGLGRHCKNRTVLGIFGRDGAFADYLTLPIENLYSAPKSISDIQAVFTEPVAACFEILDQVKIASTDRIAVIGDGKLGALAAQVVATKSKHVILIGKHDDKLERIRKSFQLKTCLATTSNKSGAFDIAIECSGSPSGLEMATALLKPRGTLVLKSTFHDKPRIDTSIWVINELTVIGSRCGRFKPALTALKSGAVDPLPRIDAVFPARDAVRAFKHANSPGVFKTLLDFSQ